MFETAIYIIRGFAIVFFIGLIVDYPEQRRKKRKENCKNGKHRFGKWIDQYEIHNGNDVWERKCKYCNETQQQVSKLTPLHPSFAYCFQCEIEMPTKIINGQLCCSNCKILHVFK